MKPIWIAVLLAVAASSVCADIAKFDPPDKRLDKKVTLEVAHTKLEDVVKSLSEQSGVTVKAGTGTRDWKVREGRVTIRAKDVPLGKTLDEITKLLGYYLSREGKEGEWTYIIWQDKKSRDLEAEMLIAEKEAEARRAEESRQASLDAAEKALKMTPEEAKKLRDNDPLVSYLGGTKSGRGYAQLLSSLSSTDMQLMMRGKRIAMPFSSLPPALQQAAMDTTASGIIAAENAGGGTSQPMVPYQVVISQLTGDINEELGPMGVAGAMSLMGLPQSGDGGYDPVLGQGHPMSVFLLSKPDSQFGKTFGKALLALEEGAPMQQVEQELGGILNDGTANAEAKARKSPTEENPPTDPKLTREVDLGKMPDSSARQEGGDAASNARAVAKISEAAGFAAMLESFTKANPIAIYLKPGKQPVYKIMIGLEKAGYTWDLEDSTLRIRPEDWAVKRSCVIPEGILTRYRELLEAQGMLTFDDLAALASEVTDDQIENSLFTDPYLNSAVGMPLGRWSWHGRDMLRLYHSLSANQRTNLTSEAGLQFGQLTEEQWDRLNTIITDRLGGLYIVEGSVRLVEPEVPSKGDGGRYVLKVSAVTEDGKAHACDVGIYVQGKANLAPAVEGRKKAREAAKTAQQDSGNAPDQPAQAPPAR